MVRESVKWDYELRNRALAKRIVSVASRLRIYLAAPVPVPAVELLRVKERA